MRNRNSRLQFQPTAQTRLRTVDYNRRRLTETLTQSAEQIESLLARRIDLDGTDLAENPRTFAPPAGNYRVGQWVDVRDTMGNWLEAQIADVQPGRVYVHYNGWGGAWDEWVDSGSERITLFRSRTVQAPTAPFMSAYPHIDPDAEIPAHSDDFEGLVDRLSSIHNVSNAPV